ncbi:MAG: hypothetical protein AAF637_08810 [Pseudomonadota bacterium]
MDKGDPEGAVLMRTGSVGSRQRGDELPRRLRVEAIGIVDANQFDPIRTAFDRAELVGQDANADMLLDRFEHLMGIVIAKDGEDTVPCVDPIDDTRHEIQDLVLPEAADFRGTVVARENAKVHLDTFHRLADGVRDSLGSVEMRVGNLKNTIAVEGCRQVIEEQVDLGPANVDCGACHRG